MDTFSLHTTAWEVAKNGLKSQQCGDREEKRIKANDKFLDLEKTPFLY